jgi:hypothetical protein
MDTTNSFDKLERLIKDLQEIHLHEIECLKSVVYVKDARIFTLELQVERLEKTILEYGIALPSISGSPIRIPC